MNVAPPHPKLPAPPSIEPAQGPRDHREPVEPFGDVLTAALQSYRGNEFRAKSPGISRDRGSFATVENRQFRKDGNSVVVGEDAVRFDARPIVGPSLAPLAPSDVVPPGPGEWDSLMPASMAVPTLEPCLRLVISLATSQIATLVSSPLEGCTSATTPARGGAVYGKGPPAAPAEPLAPVRTTRWLAQTGSSAPAETPSKAKSEARTNVSLALLGDEVFVTVRGLDLSADEEEALGDEMRRLLASSNLGGRAVRIVTSRRT